MRLNPSLRKALAAAMLLAVATPAALAMIREQEIDGRPTRRVSGNAFRIEPY